MSFPNVWAVSHLKPIEVSCVPFDKICLTSAIEKPTAIHKQTPPPPPEPFCQTRGPQEGLLFRLTAKGQSKCTKYQYLLSGFYLLGPVAFCPLLSDLGLLPGAFHKLLTSAATQEGLCPRGSKRAEKSQRYCVLRGYCSMSVTIDSKSNTGKQKPNSIH